MLRPVFESTRPRPSLAHPRPESVVLRSEREQLQYAVVGHPRTHVDSASSLNDPDPLHATRAAVEEGIIAGGGVAYIRATQKLDGVKGSNDDETTGISIIRRAIEEPLRQIVTNCGDDASVVVNKVREGQNDFGYNARTEAYENLITAGVIDPTKVARVALQNAASAASMILTTECALVNEKEESDSTPPMPGGGMY